MSKASRVKFTRKIAKIVSSELKILILSGLASPRPPLGPLLGQRNINIANFVKEFNSKTAHMKEGIPIPCSVKVNPDKTYTLNICNPSTMFYLKYASGIEKGKTSGETVAGKITLKHLYEIAKIKAEDPNLALMNLQEVTQMLVGTARSMGIQIVRKLNSEEYKQFLETRNQRIETNLKLAEEKKEAKLLRTTKLVK